MLRIFFLELYIIMEQERKIKKVYPFLKKMVMRTETILLAIFNRSYQQKVVQLYVRKEIRMQDIGKANLRKVAVIGCGFVGSASAFALM